MQVWVPARWPGDGACDLFIPVAGRVPAFGSACGELETGTFNSKAFIRVQFLRGFQGGWLSKTLQADPSPLAERFQPLPLGSSWGERVMGAVASILIEKPDFSNSISILPGTEPTVLWGFTQNCF